MSGGDDPIQARLKLALNICQFDEAAVRNAAKDESLNTFAILVMAIAGAAPAVGSFALPLVFAGPIAFLICAGITFGLVHFVATSLMKGTGDFTAFGRAQGLATIVMWVGVVPFVGPLLQAVAGLVFAAISVHNVHRIYGLSIPMALAAVLVPYVVITVICLVLIFMFGMALVAFFGAMAAAH